MDPRMTVSNEFYPHIVSQTYLELSQELGFEQMVNSPTRQENTLDLGPRITMHP